MCISPVRAELPLEGGRPQLNPEGSLKLPCGKCHICISKRAIEWATRARHEISLHEENCFITLTYNEENLRSDFIIKQDFQNFMKKLRKTTKNKIRYMVSYEYGSQYFRPHMHAILFNYSPPNQEYLMKSPSGAKLFTSKILDDKWGLGYHSIGDACEETAYYIASYALKGKEREIYHPRTGESMEIRDCMNVSSRPAIGLNFLKNNINQIINSKDIMPRYYEKILIEHDDALKEINKSKRQIKLIDMFGDKETGINGYLDRKIQNLKTRSDYENYSKLIINNAKSSLHSSSFRADYENIREDNKEIKRRKFLERRLKELSNEYSFLVKEKKNGKNVRN